ncbi:hypothetical protein AO067_05655 [Pseudomonas viridiflava ICMP 13104]|uniref:Uncharacterized protein n=1 Tax=Pseudomonas viridiflava ICMP 13104 TaxID=1198305 RepID=A0A0W0H4Y6_PSEVI|nr:hypothetical protein AO067_05655 [Pseudomonas viridiflava ICMP 13104]
MTGVLPGRQSFRTLQCECISRRFPSQWTRSVLNGIPARNIGTIVTGFSFLTLQPGMHFSTLCVAMDAEHWRESQNVQILLPTDANCHYPSALPQSRMILFS